MMLIYEASRWEGEPTNLEPPKHSELGWFEINNLPQNTFALNLLALDDIKKENFYGEHGWI